jgi:hypothetical protein
LHYGFWHPSDFRLHPFSFKILKQARVTFYHIPFSKRRKEERSLSPVRKETEEFLKKADFVLIAISPDEKVGKGKL